VTAVASDLFRSIDAATDLHAPVRIQFSQAMDAASVAATLRIDPATEVDLAWDPERLNLTITPRSHWQPGTYHTVSIPPGAMATTGRPMAGAVQAAFVTRAGTWAGISPTTSVGSAVSLTTSFRIAFDQPVERAAVEAALRVEPPVAGSLAASPETRGTSGPASPESAPSTDQASSRATAFVFTPSAPLSASTTYRVSLVDLVDGEGAAISNRAELKVTTAAAPHVVRFRPANGTASVLRGAMLSVRFSEPMDRPTTKAAFVVSIGGVAVAGKVTFAEKDTVLLFDPTNLLPYGAQVDLAVNGSARAKSSAPLSAASSVRIQVEAAPQAAPRRVAPAPPRVSTARPTSSAGAAVGGGSWGAVETYYLKLMNCTRTGGWVTSTGGCSSPGGRSVAALRLDSGISSKVSRPYAKRLAVNNQCSHFIGGNPGNRLSAAGYTSYIWAENLGCRSGNPYSAVLGSHLFFQSERSYNGGHYVNLMNAKYDRVGIGVWVSSGRVRLVIDFYHPR
jgi:uncharacterized protein YkwD